jgi:hypothetical protein
MEISTLLIQICQLKPELEILALKYTSDLEEGDELVQQTLITALYKASEFPESGLSIKKWLFSLMKSISGEDYKVPMKVVHNYFDDKNATNFQSPLDCRESLERRLRSYEDDLNTHLTALNSKHSVSETRFANKA